jgi:hypothetical protein
VSTYTFGYINGPQGAPNAQAITGDTVNGPFFADKQFNPLSDFATQKNVVIRVKYYPVAVTGMRRETFDLNGLPLSVSPGTCIRTCAYEAGLLLASGAADAA